MPVARQLDAFFVGRPDAEDLFEADGHEDADAAGGEVHEDHLPERAELKWVAQEGADLLPEVRLFDIGRALADEFIETPYHQQERRKHGRRRADVYDHAVSYTHL